MIGWQWIMNREGCGTKQSTLFKIISWHFTWKNWENHEKTSVRIAEIKKERLLDTLETLPCGWSSSVRVLGVYIRIILKLILKMVWGYGMIHIAQDSVQWWVLVRLIKYMKFLDYFSDCKLLMQDPVPKRERAGQLKTILCWPIHEDKLMSNASDEIILKKF
jgi:hypothetical protein